MKYIYYYVQKQIYNIHLKGVLLKRKDPKTICNITNISFIYNNKGRHIEAGMYAVTYSDLCVHHFGLKGCKDPGIIYLINKLSPRGISHKCYSRCEINASANLCAKIKIFDTGSFASLLGTWRKI